MKRGKNGKKKGNGWLPLLIMLASLLVFFGVMADGFCTAANLINILLQSSTMAMVGIGLSLVLIGGNFDFSCGAVIAFTGCMCARLLAAGIPSGLVLIAGVLLGAVLGAVNGICVVWIPVSSFLLTMVTSLIFRGCALALVGSKNLYGLPESFCFLGSSAVCGIPVPVLGTGILLLLFTLLLSGTVYGHRLYVTGGSKKTARMLGFEPKHVTFVSYVLSGSLAAAAGIVLTGRMASANASMGEGVELYVLAGLVIGGVSIGGGRGKLPQALAGVLLIGVLVNGMNFLDLPPHYGDLIRGLLILFALSCEMLRGKAGREREEMDVSFDHRG